MELAYLAGVFDGEGNLNACFQTGGRSVVTRARVQMVHRGTCEAFLRAFGGSLAARRRVGRHGAWEWDVCGGKLDAFLDVICPFLRLKRPEAELMRDFRRDRVNPGEFVAEMRRLKREQAVERVHN